MSFRLFIYYCAMCGGAAAFVGWALGRYIAAGGHAIGDAGIKGLWLGMLVAFALGLVDALWVFSLRRFGQIMLRVTAALLIGAVGGVLGGVVGQAFYGLSEWAVFYIFGWTITGFLIGAAPGAFDTAVRFVQQENIRGALRKLINGAVGGTMGGAVGGVLSLLLAAAWGVVFRGKATEGYWSPSAWGFVALGLCIGLMIGLAQVLLREAWVKVEAGFKAGRALILTKPEVTIGRAEFCDIGLFGDQGAERLHARIVQQGDRYLLLDAGNSPTGTFLNGQRITEPTPLRSGDAIGIGKSLLRFEERAKR